jgi:hypothetical protein
MMLWPGALASDWVWELGKEMHVMGIPGDPEWDEFRGIPSSGTQLLSSIPVDAPNPVEWTFFLRQRDVKLNWNLQLNEKPWTNLFISEDDMVSAFPIPAGALVKGTNSRSIKLGSIGRDDIEVGDFRIDRRPLRVVFRDGQFQLSVTENGARIPCRVTVVDTNGSLFPFLLEAKNAASRTGVAYLGDGSGVFKLPAGDYTIYVGRGFEYGLASQRVRIISGSNERFAIELRREVTTSGLVASDTHVHTFTHSGHGDATEDERAITLAGEGIELPIATDHNLIMDPETPAKGTGMHRYYTPVRGIEVTTGHAHFNIFPVDRDARVPNFRVSDWPDLMKEMRATKGVHVVILNHPRNVHNRFQPFASTNFNAKTGENLRGFEFSFDAIEVLNSSALQTDWMVSFRDWMALLNYGYRVTAVGSSDGHDVSRYIVGQGRSYIVCDDSDVSKIDVKKACESLVAGRVLVSMGLLADMKVQDQFSVGDLATALPDFVRVTVSVQGPGWTAVDQIELFANGELVRQEQFAPVHAPGEKRRVTWNLPKPAKDFYLVAIASGPPVTAPFWRIPKPYQPTSTTWKPRVVGATNPIWIDADGDGKFTPLRLQKQN